jgi:hypothetical protein
MALAIIDNQNLRGAIIINIGAVVGALIAGFGVNSWVAGLFGWMSGAAAGSAVSSYLNKKYATPYLFALSAVSLAVSVISIGQIDWMWIIILVLVGMFSSAIGSQIEKDKLDANR